MAVGLKGKGIIAVGVFARGIMTVGVGTFGVVGGRVISVSLLFAAGTLAVAPFAFGVQVIDIVAVFGRQDFFPSDELSGTPA